MEGLQFVGIGWIVLNQFRDHLGLEAGAGSGLVAKGYIGAGLFFVASGFLNFRRYVHLREANRFRYGSFLWRRLAFLYPLHIALLAAMVAAVMLAETGCEPVRRAGFPVIDVPANVFLVQAWGVLRTDSWNFPSWLVSAEWFACIVLPWVAWEPPRRSRWAAWAWLAPVVLFLAMFRVAEARGVLFTDMTTTVGALQAVPAFILGASIVALDQQLKLKRGVGAALAVAALLWIVVATLLRFTDMVIWPAFAPLVLGLAACDLGDARFRLAGALGYLGRISIAMQLVYLPVDMAYFRIAERLWPATTGLRAWLIWAGVYPIIIMAAVAAYHGVQRPAWRWLAARDPFARRPCPDDSGKDGTPPAISA